VDAEIEVEVDVLPVDDPLHDRVRGGGTEGEERLIGGGGGHAGTGTDKEENDGGHGGQMAANRHGTPSM
jgi:hypothetical protein